MNQSAFIRSVVPHPLLVICSLTIMLAPICSLLAQDDEKSGKERQDEMDERFYSTEQMKLWGKKYAKTSREITATIGEGVQLRNLELSDEPVMTWRNPASRAGTHGEVFTWTDDGYPVILAALWSKEISGNRYLMIESHSLVDEPMNLAHGNRLHWAPTAAADKKIEIPDLGSDISDSEEMRTGELDSIITRFAVTSGRDDSDEPVDLRIDETLIGRFSSEKYHVIDGAMFVAYYNNDPELFLVFEAVQHDGWEQWYVRFIRNSNQPLAVTYDRQALWKYEPSKNDSPFGGQQQPTISATLATLPPELSEDDVEK